MKFEPFINYNRLKRKVNYKMTMYFHNIINSEGKNIFYNFFLTKNEKTFNTELRLFLHIMRNMKANSNNNLELMKMYYRSIIICSLSRDEF